MNMPFGKHRGVPLDQVPHSYLLWVLDNCENISQTLREEIEAVLGVGGRYRRARPPPGATFGGGGGSDSSLAAVKAAVMDAVKRWHRVQATRNHPDRGGNTQVMQAINAVADELVKQIEAAFDAAGH